MVWLPHSQAMTEGNYSKEKLKEVYHSQYGMVTSLTGDDG
eukprot:CAMPEP_0204615524 /NCGR_PEP_ID=MMETSP0717-20131115/2989_1 /ASSEMBLY_ACC=CAM_ASM_000666 /TAXON_ID=230516 /ORGANISM="Chaetoceros curvisetus" /LENGTH=39 /DNA_ID= /DNA_START= /DNA_END= /DNA_ORIENTATION=